MPTSSPLPPVLLRSALCLALVAFASGCEVERAGEEPGEAAPEATESAEAVAVDVLRGRLPAAVGAMPRTDVEGEVQRALGAEVAGVTARYGADAGDGLALALTDLATAEMVEMMGYGWGLGAAAGVDRIGGFPARVEEGPAAGEATVRVLVADRFLIESVASGGGADAARAGVESLDLPALAALAGE